MFVYDLTFNAGIETHQFDNFAGTLIYSADDAFEFTTDDLY